MGDSFSFSAVTKPTLDAFSDMDRRVDRSSMWAVRETGRLGRRVARAAAPVYQGPGAVKISAVKKARKAGVTLTGGRLGAKFGNSTVEAAGQVVAGLLRDSISPSKRLTKVGSTYSLKVGPRGPRVYLYAGKIELTARYMAAGYAAVVAAARDIHEKAWAKAMSR